MKLKPKMTTLNPRALLYKRFTEIEKGISLNALYYTNDERVWVFDASTLSFIEMAYEGTAQLITVSNNACLTYTQLGTTYYFRYKNHEWEQITDTTDLTLLSAQYSNIGKYQTNKYYYAGAFNYVKKGAIEGSTTQYLKGNIMPLETLSIQHFDDNINVNIDDLVVIKNRVYMVQNPVEDHKHQPKDYTIYLLDLISIL